MFVITALELRTRMGEILKKVSLGEEIIVKYRKNTQVKLSPILSTKAKTKKTSAQQKLAYFLSDEYKKKLEKYDLNIDILDEKDPAQEKINIRNSRLSKYV